MLIKEGNSYNVKRVRQGENKNGPWTIVTITEGAVDVGITVKNEDHGLVAHDDDGKAIVTVEEFGKPIQLKRSKMPNGTWTTDMLINNCIVHRTGEADDTSFEAKDFKEGSFDTVVDDEPLPF